MGGCVFLLQLTCVQWDDWNGNLSTFLCGWISYKLWYSGSYWGYGTTSTSKNTSFDSDSFSIAN